MNARWRAPVTFVIAGAAVFAFAACADDGRAPDPAIDDEGGVIPPNDGGPAIDADSDAGAEAGPPRTCSDHGWCSTTLPPDHSLRGVWSDGAGVIWAVSEEGAVLRLSAGAGAWTVHATLSGPLHAIWGSGPLDVWVGGDEGLYRGRGATSAALAFQPNATPGDATIGITSIWGTGPNDVWAVGGKMQDEETAVSRVLRFTGATTDAGATWTLDPVGTSPYAFTKVWGTTASGVWIGGSNTNPFGHSAAVYRRPAGAPAFAKLTSFAFDPRDGVDSGVLGEFTTGGASGNDVWIAGKSLGFSPGLWRGTSTDGATFAWSHVARHLDDHRLEAIWGTSSTDAWAAGDYGRLRRWNGSTWTQAALMTGKFPITAPLHAIWGSSATDLWVVGDGIALHFDPTKAKK
ncbi:MAG: hypothetical protein KF819_13410 [Labilithrix sp.]|nr:hypothetical protein [Labilithrix sp.]